jgi:hypothetical protein
MPLNVRRTRRPLVHAAVLASALAVSGPALAGSVQTPECQRDLLVADSDIRASQNRLGDKATASIKDLCPLWRQHVEVAGKAAATYQRCLTGTDQRVKVAETKSTIADFEQALKGNCR